MRSRQARCPECGHIGHVPRGTALTAKMRCRQCGAVARLSDVRVMPEGELIVAAYGAPALDDPVDDLFRGDNR